MQTLLETLLGSKNVYFQPPASVEMGYPAIVYGISNIENIFADDVVFFSKRQYSVTVIDSDPDSLIVGRVSALPTCRHDRHFESDNLNHDVFTLFY